jgi:hypothetical protein
VDAIHRWHLNLLAPNLEGVPVVRQARDVGNYEGQWHRAQRYRSYSNGMDRTGKVGQDGDEARKAHTHPKRLRNPNISINTPMAGHLRKTRRMPPRKQAVPRSLFLRAKSKIRLLWAGDKGDSEVSEE